MLYFSVCFFSLFIQRQGRRCKPSSNSSFQCHFARLGEACMLVIPFVLEFIIQYPVSGIFHAISSLISVLLFSA